LDKMKNLDDIIGISNKKAVAGVGISNKNAVAGVGISNKKAVAGEGILMIYRLILVTFIALVVLGLSAVFYDYYIDVRDVEARIMAKQVVNCLAPDGIFDLGKIAGNEDKIMEYCGFDKNELKRFYVSVVVNDESGKEIKKLQQGDSGALWVKQIYENKKGGSIAKYEPGVFPKENEKNYFSIVLFNFENSEKKINGKLIVEVLVQHEF